MILLGIGIIMVITIIVMWVMIIVKNDTIDELQGEVTRNFKEKEYYLTLSREEKEKWDVVEKEEQEERVQLLMEYQRYWASLEEE